MRSEQTPVSLKGATDAEDTALTLRPRTVVSICEWQATEHKMSRKKPKALAIYANKPSTSAAMSQSQNLWNALTLLFSFLVLTGSSR